MTTWSVSTHAILARTALAAVSLAFICGPTLAVQHLVAPGESWQDRAARMRPGDELILMPGKHKPGLIEVLVGTPQLPITIRGVDAEHPAEIIAEREGLRIRQPRHVRIANMVITGGSVAGITLGSPAGNPEFEISDIEVRNVAIRRVGPKGQRHGVALVGLNTVTVENVRVEGWGGSGIDVAACRDVRLTHCSLKGLEEHSQLYGIRVRTGSRQVQIEHCRFDQAGSIAVCLGGASNVEDFLPAVPTDAEPRSVAEASYVNVENCFIIDAPCAVAYVSAAECAVRRNTIVRPRRSVLAILSESLDERISPGRNNIFGGNIVTWEAGDVKMYAEVSPKADTKSFSLETNLWWSPEPAEQRDKIVPTAADKPGVPEIPSGRNEGQVTQVDPKLDSKLTPTADAAQAFGAIPQ